MAGRLVGEHELIAGGGLVPPPRHRVDARDQRDRAEVGEQHRLEAGGEERRHRRGAEAQELPELVLVAERECPERSWEVGESGCTLGQKTE